ncbi:MAG TPA: restriction endonuclease subunit S [Bryobacteraceae bacterium]
MTHWEQIQLGELMPPRSGTIDPRDYPNETFELYSIPAFDTGRPERIPGSAIGSAKQLLQSGDVLLSRIVPHIRRAWVVAPANGHRLIGSGEWIVFRSPRIHPEYLRQLLISDRFHPEFMRTVAGVGGSLLRARPSGVALIKVPLPPIADQRRIAEILDHADGLIRKRDAARLKSESLRESLFLASFSNKSSLWPKVKIGDLASAMRTGPFGSQLLHSEFTSAGIAVLGIDNVVQNRFLWGRPRFISEPKFHELERYRVFAQDVLITIMATCGKCAIVPDDIPPSISTKHLCCITLDGTKCFPRYLHACFLHHPEVLNQLGIRERGAVMPGLNMGIIENLAIPLPPIDLQRRFGEQVAEIEKNCDTERDGMLHMTAFFHSLQHAAFRGEV